MQIVPSQSCIIMYYYYVCIGVEVRNYSYYLLIWGTFSLILYFFQVCNFSPTLN